MNNVFYQFHSPYFLLFLLIIPIMIIAYIKSLKSHKTTVKFPGLKIVKKANKAWKMKLRHIPLVLRCLAIAFLTIALARPQSGEHLETMNTEGIDIMLVLDVSGSMDIMDMLSNSDRAKLGKMNAEKMYKTRSYLDYTRLGYAKDVITDFVSKRKSDRIGLTIFSGRAYTQCPMTLDYGILTSLLKEASNENISAQGTAIGDAMMTGTRRLIDSKAKSRVVILLTDGSNNAGNIHPLKAADVAEATGIKVYTIGVGKASGTFLGFRQSPFTGQIFWDEMPIPAGEGVDERTLLTIAKKTGGEFYRAHDKEDLEKIYKTINELETTEIQAYSYTKYGEEYFMFLLIGAALLLLELVLANTRFMKIP